MERTHLVNVTTLVDQFSGPIGKIRQVEVLMYIVAAMSSYLVCFGSFRRSSSNAFFRYSITAPFVFSFTLITLIIGQMKYSNSNIFYPIWVIYLILLCGNYNVSAYSLEDNEQGKKIYWANLLLMGWLGWLIGLNANLFNNVWFKPISWIMVVVCSWKITERVAAPQFASKSALMRGSKFIADFMSYEHELGPVPGDPVHMKGYHYLLTSENKLHFEDNGSSSQKKKKKKRVSIGHHRVITVEKVWSCNGKLLSPTGDPDSKLKDICLSYALYNIVLCHFAGYPLPPPSREKQWVLVCEGLLQNVENYERPFRVIETELAFLYDHFYTKYATMYRFPLWKFLLPVFIIVGSSVLLVLFLKQYSSYASTFSKDAKYKTIESWLQEYKLCTIIMTGFIIFLEIIQLLMFIISYWGKLLLLSKYVGEQSWRENKLYEQLVRVSCIIPGQKCWGRKLGQYSFLDSFHRDPPIWFYNWITLIYFFVENRGKGYTGNTIVKLSPNIQRAIFSWIKRKGRRLTKGIESLRENEVRNEELSLACRLDATTQIIMVWHLATCLCEFQHARSGVNIRVSTTLSKYCAYLVVFAPRLLPEHSYVTECSFKETVQEAIVFLKGCYNSMENKSTKIMALADVEKPMEDRTVLEAGARVAKLLTDEVGDDVERMWKILADFWTEIVLFVAPSDDISVHAEYLAQGGEFVTHLWALLFHAGIVKRDDIEVVNV